MTQHTYQHTKPTQMGSCANAGAAYVKGEGDIAFATGQYILFRMPMSIPKGSTCQSATIEINTIAKNAGTAQTCINSIRAHASGDSPMLVPTAAEANKSWTAARIDWSFVWTSAGADNRFFSCNVKPIIDEILARSDYVSGGYITFMLYTDNENGSDLSVRANNPFVPPPKLTVNFTEPDTDLQTTINMCENSEFNTSLNPIDPAEAVPYWHQNEFFGYMVPSANFGTIARDTSFTRLPGIPSLRFTCNTPPADTNKRTGPIYALNTDAGLWSTFSCWVYIPTYIPANFQRVLGGDIYNGQQDVPGRGQWVPWSSNPLMNPTDRMIRWFGIDVNNFTAGWQFWISEPTVMYSKFKQMPFNGLTPDRMESGDSTTLVDYRSTVSKQQSTRLWTPRRQVMANGVSKRYPTFLKRAEGMLQIAEPIKGGPTSAGMPTQTVASLPAGKTIAEL